MPNEMNTFQDAWTEKHEPQYQTQNIVTKTEIVSLPQQNGRQQNPDRCH